MKYAVHLINDFSIKSDIFYSKNYKKVVNNGKKYAIFEGGEIIGYKIKNGRKMKSYLIKLDDKLGRSKVVGVSHNVLILTQTEKLYQYKNLIKFISIIRSNKVKLEDINTSDYLRINSIINGKKIENYILEGILRYEQI